MSPRTLNRTLAGVLLLLLAIPAALHARLVTISGAPKMAVQASQSGGDFVASTQSLNIIYPRAAGDAGSGLDSNSRVFKQYPGIPLRLRVGIIGGTWPYTVSLSGAPSGMTIEEVQLPTGNVGHDIVWQNPIAGTYSYTLNVEDAAGGTDTETIEDFVVGTSGHLFIDSAAESSGSGTEGSPYQQLDDLYGNRTATNSVCWFRGGGPAYVFDNIETASSTTERRVEFSDFDQRCIIWIAYPGDERPVIDYGHTSGDTGSRLRFGGSKIHVEGFHFTNGYVMGLQLDRRNLRGAYIANNVFDELNVIAGSSNQAHIMTMGGEGSSRVHNMMIVGNDFSLPGNENVANAIKTYYEEDFLIEGNVFHDMDKPIELKENAHNFTVRNNAFTDSLLGIAGDLADNEENNASRGDICWNYIHTEATGNEEGALRLNDGRGGGDGAGPIDVYRNTIIGRILVDGLEETQGPMTLARNVILNDESEQTPWSYITDSGTVSAARLTKSENLEADFDDPRVDETTGALSGDWAEYAGRRGHRLH